MKGFYKKIAVFISSVIVFSCSGGGGGGSDTSSTSSDIPTTPPVNQQQNISTVSLSINSIKSGDSLTISLKSFDTSGNVIDTKIKTIKSTGSSYTELYQLITSENGGKITITVEGQGYATWFKQISYSNPSEVKSLNVLIQMIAL